MSRTHASLFAARAAAWALLLMGWVGLGSLALVLAGSVLQAQAMVALWLLAVGAVASVGPRVHGAGLLAAAVVAALGLWAAPRGGGALALALGMAGWAALLAAASAVVRQCRLAAQASQAGPRLPPPLWPAAAGALLAGAVLGDPGAALTLSGRLAIAALIVSVVLARLRPADAAAPATGCRAGLFDCSLPAWPPGAWREPSRWPLGLATLAMLPMMASLPLMLAACRAEGWSPTVMLALHGLAMFVPALLVHQSRVPVMLVGGLLALAVPALALPALQALLVATLAHGAAWSLAWRAQLAAPRAAQAPRRPLAAALTQGLWVLGVGAWLAEAGPAGLLPLQAALGAAAALATAVAAVSYAGRKPSIER